MSPGQTLIALASSGFHTNGYSLLRRLFFDRLGLSVHDTYPETDLSVGDVLLRPHRSYATSLLPLIADGSVQALAHITGGGIAENLVRVLPEGAAAHIDRSSWHVPTEFAAVQHHGGISDEEMFLTFNMGVGMILVVASERVDATLAQLAHSDQEAWIIGVVEQGEREVTIV